MKNTKKIIALILCAAISADFTACGNTEDDDNNSAEITSKSVSEQTVGSDDTDASAAASAENSRVLIAYFSVPEDVDTDGVDAVAGASVVVSDGEKLGNIEYTAKLVQQTVGGELFRIETVQDYPLDHEKLVDFAYDEQSANARPELSSHIDDLEKYDTVILGYPNWWGDMPMPVYTFLEEYDFGAKTIIPFTVHGGSGLSRTVQTISELQPGAHVSDNTLSISRNDISGAKDEIIAWAESLGIAVQ